MLGLLNTVTVILATNQVLNKKLIEYFSFYNISRELLVQQALYVLELNWRNAGDCPNNRVEKASYLHKFLVHHFNQTGMERSKLLAVVMDDIFLEKFITVTEALASHIGRSICCDHYPRKPYLRIVDWSNSRLRLEICFGNKENSDAWLNNTTISGSYVTHTGVINPWQ